MKPILLEGMSQILPESRDMLVVIFQIALKATALLVMTYAAHSLAGRRRALFRSVCWNTCLVGLLLVPVACLTFPRLTLPILPSQDRVAGPSTPQTRLETATDFDRFDVKNQSRLAIQAAAITEPRSSMPDFEITKSSTTGLEPVQSLAPIRHWRHDATVIGLGLYLSITTLLLLRLGLSLRAIQRLRRDCQPVHASLWLEGLSRSASKVGITRPVQLLMSDQISVPIVIDWLNPAVILPRSLTDTTTSGLVDAVLLHELAHIRRGDFGWNLLHRVVMVLYWPHPLVWPLARIISAVREQACDDLCVHMLGGPNDYHDSLVEVAAGLLTRPEPSLGMAMARPTALGQRIEWIHRTRGAADCLLRWPLRLAIASTIISMAGMIGSVELARASAEPVEIAQEPKDSAKLGLNSKTPEAIEITVLAKDTGKPLKDARIEAYIDRKMEHLRTDASGKARIDLNGRMFLDMMSMDLWADGYVQQRRAFSEKGQEKQPIPAALTIELLPGEETLGGKVVDEQGQPIAGAKVEIWGHLGEKKEPHELAYHVDATTDNQGQWRCRSFRKMNWAHLYISHPDFLADTDQTPRVHGRISPDREPAASEQPIQALRDFTDVQVMKKGIRVEGWVADTAGKPVNGAEIDWIVLDRSGPIQPESWLARADSNGRFTLPHARAGQIVIQVKAPGHAPVLKPVTVREGLEPLRITLGRPQKLLGRVVDTKGAPIPGCEVRVDSWRGYGGPVFYLKTDAEGRFRWDESPVGDVLVSVIREGFESILRFRLNPTGGETPITLKRSLNVSGPILDARTGDPIKANAEIDFGTMDPATGQISWKGGRNFLYSDRSIRVAVIEGQIMASLDAEASPDYRLRIRIKGYQPLESRVFRSDEGQVAYDFRLIKDNSPQGVIVSGVVRRPDGKPLEAASVAVAYDSTNQANLPGVQIVEGNIRPIENQSVVKTDAEGRFSLTRENDPDGLQFALVVAHPDFYAQVPKKEFEANSVIVAKPWGRIEGIAQLGNRLASNADIHWHSDDHKPNPGEIQVLNSGDRKTDSEGRFVIDRVVPGVVRVNRFVEDKLNHSRRFATTIIKVKPGETSRVEIGGKGRPVIARIDLPEGFDPKADYVANSGFSVQSDQPLIPYPKEILAGPAGAKVEWAKRWRDSPEGLEYRRNWLEFGTLKLRQDGTIRIEEVPPGEYKLTLAYSGEPVDGRTITPLKVGYATMKFTVPEIPGSYTDEPLDLGRLHPKQKPSLELGQQVPEFDVETFTGKRLKLADFRGKYVLLDFWATWCGPCVAEIPEMKAVYERFGKEERFAMVSLSLDAEKDVPSKFVAENRVAWHQGFLGEAAEGGVQDSYHVEAIPATFLIGPDGKLVAKDLRGIEIGAAVGRALNSR